MKLCVEISCCHERSLLACACSERLLAGLSQQRSLGALALHGSVVKAACRLCFGRNFGRSCSARLSSLFSSAGCRRYLARSTALSTSPCLLEELGPCRRFCCRSFVERCIGRPTSKQHTCAKQLRQRSPARRLDGGGVPHRSL